MVPKPSDKCSHMIKTERDQRHTEERRRPSGCGNRVWSHLATSQGKPGVTRTWKRQGRLCPRACGGSMALNSILQRKQTSVVSSHLVCGHLLQQPQETNRLEPIRSLKPIMLEGTTDLIRCCLCREMRTTGRDDLPLTSTSEHQPVSFIYNSLCGSISLPAPQVTGGEQGASSSPWKEIGNFLCGKWRAGMGLALRTCAKCPAPSQAPPPGPGVGASQNLHFFCLVKKAWMIFGGVWGAVLSLHCWALAFSSCSKQGLLASCSV